MQVKVMDTFRESQADILEYTAAEQSARWSVLFSNVYVLILTNYPHVMAHLAFTW